MNNLILKADDLHVNARMNYIYYHVALAYSFYNIANFGP